MKRSLSGIQPSGILHLGNYFGAIKQFIENQDKYEGFYFVADYHSLTSLPNPEDLRKNSFDVVLDYLALGLDPEKATIFLQSDVPEHTELAWLLASISPMGLLERGHSYKDKTAKGIPASVGLFTYPVLMAADILIYDSEVVPVGKDQKQHLEMARDIATKFNLQYGETFLIPEPLILENLAVVPGVDGQKMSKSYGNTIEMFASKGKLKKQVMSIVTDSTPLEESKDPDNNIVDIYKLFATKVEVEELQNKFKAGNYGYGHGKKELLEKILAYFEEARLKRAELEKNPEEVERILQEGAEKAREIAKKKLKLVRERVGLLK